MAQIDSQSSGELQVPPPAVIYLRVSTDEQAKVGLSLRVQEQRCRALVNSMGWHVDTVFCDVMSGKRDDRPDYQRMLEGLRGDAGAPRMAVVAALDRLGRKLLERVRCQQELKALGVRLYTVREGGEISDFVANVLAAVAEEEVRTLSIRISEANRHATENGWLCSGGVTWGYPKRPATEAERADGAPRAVVDIDPVSAPYVKEMFARFVAGEPLADVADWVRGLPDVARDNRQQIHSRLRHHIKSPTYVSRPMTGGQDVLKRHRMRWSPLVDDLTWRRAQERLKASPPDRASGRHPFSGLVQCPTCGNRASVITIREKRYPKADPKPKTYVKYVCHYHASRGKPRYRRATRLVNAELVDRQILAKLRSLVSELGARAGQRRDFRTGWRRIVGSPAVAAERNRTRELGARVRVGERRLAKATDLLAKGHLDSIGYELVRVLVSQDINAASAELAIQAARSSKLPSATEVVRYAAIWERALKDGNLRGQREVARVLIDLVQIQRQSDGAVAVDVNWSAQAKALREALTEIRHRMAE